MTIARFWLAGFMLALPSVAPAKTWSNITAYPIPTASCGLWGITAGPDDALWFTEQSSNNIGRITTSGGITEYPVPTAASAPYGIVAGPDGALWFTEFYANKIGRITTAGAITAEYPTPTAFSYPNGIAAGPDGALWFTEWQVNKIGRITTSGMMTEYQVPGSPKGGPSGIAAGPDGALWFVDPEIGRITTAGVITEYPAPASLPLGITAGPDGALWFTESESNNIARAPACGLGLSASFANGTLTMNFNLGIDTPATWYATLHTGTGGVKRLWSKPIPAVVPPDSFTRTFGPGFPNLGDVTILSGLETAGEGLCYETVTVNTAQ